MNNEHREFFISYTQADKEWAEWIAHILEKNGHSCFIQSWDFKTSENFVLNMHKALENTDRFIAVLSKDYVKSEYCNLEWSSAITKDPTGEKELFFTVRVDDIAPSGIFSAIVYIDLFSKDLAADAAKILLIRIDKCDSSREISYDTKVRYPSSLPENHNIPYLRNIYFTGRDDTLRKISERFTDGQAISLTQSITGLGGLGKTQIALEYAYRYCSKYNCIWWVPSETEATMLTAYRNFAHKMKLVSDQEQDDYEVIINKVLTWMDTHSKWLFIYDNADNISADTKWWPRNNRENILITTRNRRGYIGEPLNISEFTKDEAAAFFEKRTGIEGNRDDALVLSERLGYLPLALEQAAAYIRNTGCTYAKYITLLEKYGLKLLERIDGVIAYKQPVTVTWQISIDMINNEAAQQIMYLCAYLASDGIDAEIFTENKDLLSELLKEELSDELAALDIWSELTKYSLLGQQDGALYSMHRLLQEVVRDKVKDDPQWARYCLAVMYEIHEFTYETQARFISLLPHVKSFVTNSESILTDDEEQKAIAYLCMVSGSGEDDLANYPQALEWYFKASAIREKVLGLEHTDTAISYNNIGVVYDNQSEYDNALEWYFKALAIYEKILGLEHPNTATSYNNIGMVYYRQGDYDNALQWYFKALPIREKVLGLEHPDTATSYNNIGMVYYRQGDYDNALQWSFKALTIKEKKLGLEHPSTATSYNNIGGVYDSQGEYDNALQWYFKALAIREKKLGLEHPSTATSYNNIGNVYKRQGEYDNALQWYFKDLAICEKKLGLEHPDTATSYNNIGSVYDSKGEYDNALQWYFKALAIYEKKLGTNHPSTKITRENIEITKSKM